VPRVYQHLSVTSRIYANIVLLPRLGVKVLQRAVPSFFCPWPEFGTFYTLFSKYLNAMFLACLDLPLIFLA
jgi:hypothetical protein